MNFKKNIVKKKALIIILMSVLSIFSTTTYGGCDACMQAAAKTAESTLTSALSSTLASVETRVKLTKDLAQAIKQADININATLTSTNQQFRKSLDASGARIAMEISRNTKAVTDLTTHQVSQMTTTLKEKESAEQKIQNDRDFSQLTGQPVSGDVMVDRTIALKSAMVAREQILDGYMKQTHEINNSIEANDKKLSSRHIKDIAEEDEILFSPTPLITGTQIQTIDEQENTKKFIRLLTNYNPISNTNATDKISSAFKANERELNRRIWNAKIEAVQYVLADEMLDKVGLIDPTEWKSAYMEEAQTDENGKVSMAEMLRAEVDGRIMTPGWYKNMKEMGSTGLSREIIYQKATQLKLMWELLKKEDHTLRLLAIKTSMALQEDKKRIMGLK